LASLRDKTMSSKDLNEMASIFRGATIESIEKAGDSGATVEVKLGPPRGAEYITVLNEDGSWKVQAF